MVALHRRSRRLFVPPGRVPRAYQHLGARAGSAGAGDRSAGLPRVMVARKGQRLWYQKYLELVPSLAFQKEREASPASPPSRPSGAGRLLLLGTAPASVRPDLHARGSTGTIAPVRTVEKYLVHKVCNCTRNRRSTAVILAGNLFATLFCRIKLYRQKPPSGKK